MNTPLNVNHIAYQTHDMEATHHFYTEVLGLPFVGAMRESGKVASNGATLPAFLHTFYALPSGTCIAFFEVAGAFEHVADNWPLWTRHLALECGSEEQLEELVARVRSHGVEVRGAVDHDEVWFSYYCFDPSGVHIELTHQVRALDDHDLASGLDAFASWVEDKKAGALA